MEVLPPTLPARVRTSKAVGGSELYKYWLSLEIEHYTATRDKIARDLKTLHAKLIQGFSTLSEKELVVYQAIYRSVKFLHFSKDNLLILSLCYNLILLFRLHATLQFFNDNLFRNQPPQSWLYEAVSPNKLTNLSWIRVLFEARAQLITLHEGGSGIWAGCLADPRVLLHSLVQEKSEADGIQVSQVC